MRWMCFLVGERILEVKVQTAMLSYLAVGNQNASEALFTPIYANHSL